MQICLSQQSLSPSHHFLHSNAFSHLYKIPPFRHTPWMCSFCRLTLRYFCTFDSGEEMRDRCGCFACSNLHVLSPGVSGDNKNGRVGRFFFSSLYGASTSPLCFQQEAVRLCEGSVAWMRKVNVFFFSLPTLQTHSVLSVHCGTWRE